MHVSLLISAIPQLLLTVILACMLSRDPSISLTVVCDVVQEACLLQQLLARVLVRLLPTLGSYSALGQGRAQQPPECPMPWPVAWAWCLPRRLAHAL